MLSKMHGTTIRKILFSTGIEPGRPTSMCLIYTAYQVHACALCNNSCPVSFLCVSCIRIINVYGRLLYVAESALMDTQETRTDLVTYNKAEVLKHPSGVLAEHSPLSVPFMLSPTPVIDREVGA